MNLNVFFATASPTTLASLIADVRALCGSETKEQAELEAGAGTMLIANLGLEEARELVDEMASTKTA